MTLTFIHFSVTALLDETSKKLCATLAENSLHPSLAEQAQAEAESALLVATLRKQLRELSNEREALSDVTAAMVPLPAFIRQWKESEDYAGTTGSTFAEAIPVTPIKAKKEELESDESCRSSESTAVEVTASNVFVKRSSRRKSLDSVFSTALDDFKYDGDLSYSHPLATNLTKPSSLIFSIHQLVSERPLMISMINSLDGKLRNQAVNLQKLEELAVSKDSTIDELERELMASRKLLQTSRSEISNLIESRDTQLEVLNQAKGEISKNKEELAGLLKKLDEKTSSFNELEKENKEIQSLLLQKMSELKSISDRFDLVVAEHASDKQMMEASKSLALRLAESTSNEIKCALETQIVALTNRISSLESDLVKARRSIDDSSDRVRELLEEQEARFKQLVQTEEKLYITKGYLTQSQEECKRALEKVCT
jgi:hypothetical protein